MSQAVREFLDSFDRLTEAEQREAFSLILERSQAFETPDLDDETLARIADETFLMYDQDEAAHGRP